MTAIRNEIRFSAQRSGGAPHRRCGRPTRCSTTSRLARRLRGTKEGCAEGDCGACTVLVGRRAGDGAGLRAGQRLHPLRSRSLDGCHVVTVEHLAGATARCTRCSRRWSICHGSQCGFCTPGFVMSLYALWMREPDADAGRDRGRRCRATSAAAPATSPILRRRADRRLRLAAADRLAVERARVLARLAALDDGARVEIRTEGDHFVVPASVDDLAERPRGASRSATIVAGSTDVGLWVTKFMRDIEPAVFIERSRRPARHRSRPGRRPRSAPASATTTSRRRWTPSSPHLSDYWRRIGGWQVRNDGHGRRQHRQRLADRRHAARPDRARRDADAAQGHRRGGPCRSRTTSSTYGKQDRQPGEFVEAVIVPKPAAGHGERRLQDHQAASTRTSRPSPAACRSTLADGTVTDARIAFGGMAATPEAGGARRGGAGRQALERGRGRSAPMAALADDFTADHRLARLRRLPAAMAAQNLLRRFLLESARAGRRWSRGGGGVMD